MASYDQYKKYITSAQAKRLNQAQILYNNQHADERNEMSMNNQQLIDQNRRFLQNRGLAANMGNQISGEEPRFKVPLNNAFDRQNAQLRKAEDAQVNALAANMAAQTKAERAARQNWLDELSKQDDGTVITGPDTLATQDQQFMADIAAGNKAMSHGREDRMQQRLATEQAAKTAQQTAKASLPAEDYNRMQNELNRAGLSGQSADVARINAAQMAMQGAYQAGNLNVPDTENQRRWDAEKGRVEAYQKQQYLSQNEVYQKASGDSTRAKERMDEAQNRMAELERQMDAMQTDDIMSEADFKRMSNMNEEWLSEQATFDRMKQIYADSVKAMAMAEASYDTMMDDMRYVEYFSQYSDDELEALYKEADSNLKFGSMHNIDFGDKLARMGFESTGDDATRDAALLARMVAYRKADLMEQDEAWSAELQDHATAKGYTGDWHDYDFGNGADSIYYRAVVDNDVLHDIEDVFRKSYDTNGPSTNPDVMEAISDHTSHENDFFYAEYAAFMDDQEKQTFIDLYNKQGATAADKYFEALMLRLDDRAADNVSEEAKAEANKNGWFITAAKSVGINFGKAISAPMDNIYYSARGLGVTKTQAYKNDYAQLLREAILPEDTVGNLLGSTALSMADSSVAALISKALPGVGGALLGSSAYNSALREAYDRGITGQRAQATAIMSGINEMVFEELSIEKLNKIREAGTVREWIGNIFKQSVNEGSEEFFTDVANAYADYFINDGQAELISQYNDLVRGGYSKADAWKTVASDFGEQLLMSFLGGAISGGVMGGGATLTQNAAAHMTQSNNAGIKALGNALLNTGDQYMEVATGAQLNERGAQIRNDAALMAELENHEYSDDASNDLAVDQNKNNVELARLEQQYNYEQKLANQVQGVVNTDGAVQKLMGYKFKDELAQDIVKKAGGNVENLKNGDIMRLYATMAQEEMANVNGTLQNANVGSVVAIQDILTGNEISANQAAAFLKDEAGRKALEQITGVDLKDGATAESVMKAANDKAKSVASEYGTMPINTKAVEDKVRETAKQEKKEAKHADKQRSPFLNKNSVISGDDKTQTIKTSNGNTVTIALKEGSVRYLSEQAKATVDMCRILAELDPQLNIIVRDTFADENTSVDETPNGKYYNNTIEIALDSYDSLGYTTFHEFTHHLESVSPEAFARYKSVVIEQVNAGNAALADADIKRIINRYDGMTAWEALVENKRQQYAKDSAVKAEMEKSGRKFSFADAEKEVLADIGARMINTDEVKNALAEETGLKTAKTVRDWFRNLAWSIKNLITGQEMQPAEVQYLEQTANNYSDIASAYAKMIQETSKMRREQAAERARMAAEAADPVNQEYAGDDTVRNSIRSFTNAAGIMAIKDKNTGTIHFEIDGKTVNHVTADHIKMSGLGALITYAAEGSHTITAKEAKIQYQAAADIMNMIMNTQNPEMVWAYAGSTLFSALKSNADGQYGTTIDFTTVCRKTQEMITAMSKSMIDLGRGLTRKEVTELQRKLHESGADVPCPVCYVFSRWAGIGSVLDKIRDAQERFSSANVDDAALRKRVGELSAEINKRKLIKVDGKNQTQTAAVGQLVEENTAELEAVRAALSALDTEYDSLSRSREKLQMKNSSSEEENASLSELQKRLRELELDRDILGEYVWLRDVRMQKDYTPVPNNVLYDLDGAAEFSSKWPAAWKYRTTRGPATGKAILPYSDMRLGDMILGVKSNSSTGNKKFAEVKDGKFNAQQSRAIASAIARTRAQNLIGGQRFQSTSDFRYEYALDYLQTFWEAQALGSKLQTYTKVIEFADMIAAVGGDVNLSVMPRGKGYQGNVLDFSNVTGINVKAAREANAKYDNVQLILVGINDQHIRLALEDSTETGGADIGFVIPWHASGANAEFTQALVENLGEEYTRKNYQNYEAVQTDHVRSDRTDLQKDRADLRKYILTAATSGKNQFKLSEAQEQWIRNEAAQKTDIIGMSFEQLAEIEQKAMNGDQEALKQFQSWTSDALLNLYTKLRTKEGSEYGVKLSSTQAAAVMPHEYWNKNTTRENAYINGFLFRSYCYNLGLYPRFTGMTSAGSKVDYGDFSSSKGYWKTLIDRPMYRNAENGGTYRDQQTVNVTNFDKTMLKPEYAERVYPDYKIQEPNKERAKRVGQEYADIKITGSVTQFAKRYTEQDLKNTVAASEEESKTIDATDIRNIARIHNEIDRFLEGNTPANHMILIGKPSAILQKYMKSDKLMYTVQRTIVKNSEGGKHGLGRVVIEELPFQFEDPLAITGNTSSHEEAKDNSIVVWTNWMTNIGSPVVVPIRIDAKGNVGVYNNINTIFDVHDNDYLSDLVREGNVLYTKNNENILDLLAKQRDMLNWKIKDVSNDIVFDTSKDVNRNDSETTKFSSRIQDAGLFQNKYQAMDREEFRSLIRNMNTNPAGLEFMSPERVFDTVAKNNPKLRQFLADNIEKPWNEAAGTCFGNIKKKAADYSKEMKRLGITTSKLSAAVQRYGERSYQTKCQVTCEKLDGGKYRVTVLDDEFGKQVHTMSAIQIDTAFQGYAATVLANADKEQPVDCAYAPYTEKMLKEQLPDQWTDVVAADKLNRQIYNDYITSVNKMLESIYPFVVEETAQMKEDIEAKVEEAKENRKDQAALIRKLQNMKLDLENQLNSVKTWNNTVGLNNNSDQAAEYAGKEADLNAQIRKLNNRINEANNKLGVLDRKMQAANTVLEEFMKEEQTGGHLRNKRLMPRKDYYHHFQELSNSAFGSLKNILRGNTEISPELAGKSQNTKPNSKWTDMLQRRIGGKYKEDSVNGMYKYIITAETILAYDPVIKNIRDFARELRHEAATMEKEPDTTMVMDSKKANNFFVWLDKWANNIAGKSDDLDRMLAEKIGTRKVMQILGWMNGQVKKAKLLFNVRSAVVQVSNMTNAMSYVDLQDWKAAFNNFFSAVRDENLQAIQGRSNFLTQRLTETNDIMENFDEETLRDKGDKFAGAMLSFGDNLSSQLTWWAAYNQFNRIGAEAAAKKGYREYSDAVDYADDITRRTHGGRGIGEVPLILKSKVVNIFMPFQVEVLNTFENLVQKLGRKDALGIAKMETGIFAFNLVTRLLFGDGILGFDFIHALIASLKEWIAPEDKEEDIMDRAMYMFQQFNGELISGVPFAAQLISSLIPNEDSRKRWFGEDQDPTRYGTGTLGISAANDLLNVPDQVMDLIKAAIKGEDVKAGARKTAIKTLDATIGNFAKGGTQIMRTAKGLEAFVKGYGENDNGKVQFAIDQDAGELLRMLFFGKWSTPEAREYLGSLDPVTDAFYQDSGFKLLDDKKTAAYKEFVRNGGKGKDFFKLTSQLNATTGDKDENGKTIDGTATVNKQHVIDSYNLNSTLREQMARLFVINDARKPYMDRFEAAGGKSDDFLDVLAELLVLSSDKDENGKTINGSKKKKYEAILDKLNLTDEQYGILMEMYK